MQIPKKLIKTLRSLLNLAEGKGATPHEKRVANEKAKRLAKSAGIKLDDFKKEIATHTTRIPGRLTTEFKQAAILVHAIIGCDVSAKERYAYVTTEFQGPNRYEAASAYEYLVRFQKKAWDDLVSKKRYRWKSGMEPTVHRRSFLTGIFQGILYKYNQMQMDKKQALRLEQGTPEPEPVPEPFQPPEPNPYALAIIPKPKPEPSKMEMISSVKPINLEEPEEEKPPQASFGGCKAPEGGDVEENEDLNHPPNNPDRYSYEIGLRLGYQTRHGFF